MQNKVGSYFVFVRQGGGAAILKLSQKVENELMFLGKIFIFFVVEIILIFRKLLQQSCDLIYKLLNCWLNSVLPVGSCHK